MSDIAISIDRVSKMYRVFKSPRQRMLDALGIPVPSSSYDEFWALKNISLTLKRGERVGIIGRNGAGKSTLLKLIANLAMPTRGAISVNGKVQALMELGTGFHPEFSGRENIVSALAYQGVTGRKSRQLLDEVIEFSELEEFIDKPVKTYSAGMYARLAFAVSTTIRPEILIVDEILGAGDAYFAGKSSKRMRALTADGTSVLFVSHDIASVQLVCDRVVWMERGTIIADGDPIEIGKSYAASIRRQEELRLRAVNLKLNQGHLSELLTDTSTEKVLILRLVTPNGGAPKSPLRVFEAALHHKGSVVDRVTVGGALDDDRTQRVHVLSGRGFMNWSPPIDTNDGTSCREFADLGGSYGHAPFSAKVPLGLGPLGEFSFSVTHSGAEVGQPVLLQVFDGMEYKTLLELTSNDGSGKLPTDTAGLGIADDLAVSSDGPAPEKSDFSYGAGTAWFDDVVFLNSRGESQKVFEFGEAMTVELNWFARESIADMTFVVCIYGMDGRCVSQVASPFVSAVAGRRSGIARVRFAPLMIGKGDYVVSIGIFRGMTEKDTVGEHPLDVQDRKFRIRVVAPPDIRMDRGQVVHPVDWEMEYRAYG